MTAQPLRGPTDKAPNAASCALEDLLRGQFYDFAPLSPVADACRRSILASHQASGDLASDSEPQEQPHIRHAERRDFGLAGYRMKRFRNPAPRKTKLRQKRANRSP